jgi:hypothetical protein
MDNKIKLSNLSEYQQKSEALEAKDFEGIRSRVSNIENLACILENLGTVRNAGKDLDAFKKAVFYGKDSRLKELIKERCAPKSLYYAHASDEEILERALTEQNLRILHGIIGIATELEEIIDAYERHVICGQPLDHVNLGEECADISWYIAAPLLGALGLDWHEMLERNVNKLHARYNKGRFDSEDSVNRDLEKERKILEGKED